MEGDKHHPILHAAVFDHLDQRIDEFGGRTLDLDHMDNIVVRIGRIRRSEELLQGRHLIALLGGTDRKGQGLEFRLGGTGHTQTFIHQAACGVVVVDHNIAVTGEVDVALDGVRARLHGQLGGPLGVFRGSLVEAAVGHNDGGPGKDLLTAAVGLNGVQGGGPVVGHNAVRTGQDGGVHLVPGGLDPDGHGAGLDIAHSLPGGGGGGDEGDARTAAVGVEHHVDGLLRHIPGEVQYPADAWRTGAGGFQHFAVCGEHRHIHQAVLRCILGKGGGHLLVLDAEAGQGLFLQAGHILGQSDARTVVFHSEVPGHLPHQGGGTALPGGHRRCALTAVFSHHGGGHHQVGHGLVNIGIIPILRQGLFHGQIREVGGHPQALDLRVQAVVGERDLTVGPGGRDAFGFDHKLLVDILIDHAVLIEDGELIGLVRGDRLAVGGGMGHIPAIRHVGALHAVACGGVLPDRHLPEGVLIVVLGWFEAVGDSHPPAIVDGALELHLGLDAEVPAEVPHREDHIFISVAHSAADLQRAAGDAGVVAPRHTQRAVIEQVGVVKVIVHFAVDIEGQGGALLPLVQGEHPAALLLFPPYGGRDRLVFQQGGDLLGNGVGGDGLRTVKLEGALHHPDEIGLQGVKVGGRAPADGDLQRYRGLIVLEGQLGGKAAALPTGDNDGSPLGQEVGARQDALQLVLHRGADIPLRGAAGHRDLHSLRRQIPDGLHWRYGLQLHRDAGAVHAQLQREGSQRPALDRQQRHAVGKVQADFGCAGLLQGDPLYFEVGQPTLAQEPAVVPQGIGPQLPGAQGPVIDPDAVILGFRLVGRAGLPAVVGQPSPQDDLLGRSRIGGVHLALGRAVQIPGCGPGGLVKHHRAGGTQGALKGYLQPGICPLLELHGGARGPGEDAPTVCGLVHSQQRGISALVAAVALAVHKILHRVGVAVDRLRHARGEVDLAVVQHQAVALKVVGALARYLVHLGAVDIDDIVVLIDRVPAPGQVRPGARLRVGALQAVQTEDQPIFHICVGNRLHIPTQAHGFCPVDRCIAQVDANAPLHTLDQGALHCGGRRR